MKYFQCAEVFNTAGRVIRRCHGTALPLGWPALNPLCIGVPSGSPSALDTETMAWARENGYALQVQLRVFRAFRFPRMNIQRIFSKSLQLFFQRSAEVPFP